MNDERRESVSLTSMTCPDLAGLTREDLLLHLVGQGSERERATLESHLRTCDTCVRELAHMQRRLSVADEVPHPVPAAVREAARRALASARREAAAEPGRRVWSDFRGWLERVLDLRVLVPVSVAAGALFMVGVQEMWVRPATEGERVRAVEVREELRVTAPEAMLRVRPSAEAVVTATLRRGTVVRVAGEERGWLWVLLPDGESGWVERRAFE